MPDGAVNRISLQIPPSPRRRVSLHVGRGLCRSLIGSLTSAPGRVAAGGGVAVVADRRLSGTVAGPIVRSLSARGRTARLFGVRAGEAGKTREEKGRLEDRLLAARFGRDSLIIAVGGGSLLDLAGFTAATFARGVPWIAVPTTLLAMVDASIGGKTAVNHPLGKNLIGCFHHPEAVWADIDRLDTLPPRQYRGGIAEIVKIAAGLSAPLFRRLEESAPRLLRRETGTVVAVVSRAAALKASLVARDERDLGPRHALNFGHTIGHALETASGYSLSHGEAVSIGMAAECRIARLEGRLPETSERRVVDLLVRFGLPVRLPSGCDPARIARLTRADKKTRQGRVHYALPSRIGSMGPGGGRTRAIPEGLVRRALASLR